MLNAVIPNFVIICMFIFSSKNSLQPRNVGKDTPVDLSCGGDEEVAAPSRIASRPGTLLTPTLMSRSSSPYIIEVEQRSATPLYTSIVVFIYFCLFFLIVKITALYLNFKCKILQFTDPSFVYNFIVN